MHEQSSSQNIPVAQLANLSKGAVHKDFQPSLDFHVLDKNQLEQVIELALQHTPRLSAATVQRRLTAMFEQANSYFFGLYLDDTLKTVASGFIHTRLTTGKELEIDHVIVSKDCRSSGQGRDFLKHIEWWAAKQMHCQTVTVNTSLSNANAQRFYHRAKYQIGAFHFQKEVHQTAIDGKENSSQFFADE